MIKVCLVGATGRMGTLLRTAISESGDMKLSGAIVAPNAPECDQAIDGVIATSVIERGIAGADLVLDFSDPSVSLKLIRSASELRIPYLLGTTGHSAEDRRALESLVPDAPLLVAPNTSVGIYVMSELSRIARSILGPSFDVEILELHHQHKVDAPSGTAKLLAQHTGGAVVDRSRGGDRESGTVGVASLRGGDVPGEHTVFFLGRSERLEITHRVRDRAVFAEGAVRLGRRLLALPPGRYGVGDILR